MYGPIPSHVNSDVQMSSAVVPTWPSSSKYTAASVAPPVAAVAAATGLAHAVLSHLAASRRTPPCRPSLTLKSGRDVAILQIRTETSLQLHIHLAHLKSGRAGRCIPSGSWTSRSCSQPRLTRASDVDCQCTAGHLAHSPVSVRPLPHYRERPSNALREVADQHERGKRHNLSGRSI